MSFPQDPLDFEVMISTDGSSFNEDITDYVYTRDEQGGILIERGRADETDTFDSGRCTIEVDNRDLRFTPRNPNSPYYGQIGRNTPIRVSVMTGSTYLYTPGNTSRGTTVDDASLAITGDIDIRVEAELVDWAPIDGVELCGRWGPTAGQFGWILIGYQGGLLFFWSPDGTVANFAQSDDLDFTPYTRRAVRVTLDVNNGASGRTITFYTAESIDGPWEQLGDPVVQSGTTSIFDNDRSVDVGAVSTIAYPDPEGKFYRFELRNGIDGTVVANPDWTAQAAGTTSFADDAGRTWTLFGDAEITNRKIRFTGEIPSWPVQSDTSGNDVSVKLQAAGVLRRYRQGSSPIQSALRKRIPSYNPLAYWPLEDGESSTTAMGLPAGVQPMTQKYLHFAQDDTLASSGPLPVMDFTNGSVSLLCRIPAAPFQSAWHCRTMYRLATGPATQRTFMRVLSIGTVREWRITQGNSATGSTIIGNDVNGANVFTQAVATGDDIYGQWILLELQVVQNGSNVDWQVDWKKLDGTAGAISGSYAGTVGWPQAISGPIGGYSPDLSDMAIGHYSAGTGSLDTAYDNALDSWTGEYAADRIRRLADEEGVNVSFFGVISETEPVGAQGQQQILNLLREAADADGGMLYEHRESIRLLYRSRTGMYDQKPKLILDYDTDDRGGLMPPLLPLDDDSNTRNLVTISRDNGSSATAEQTTGALNTSAPPTGVGQYPTSVSLSLADDSQTVDQAGWALHLGTVDEPRYPSVSVWLQKTGVNEELLELDSGDRMQILNPPAKLQNDTIDMMVQGYSEFISQYRWEFEFNTSPYAPWLLGWVGPSDEPRDVKEWNAVMGDPAVSTAVALGETDTVLSLRNNATERWTEDASDYPFDMKVAGERVTMVAPGAVVNDNPLFDTDVTGWGGSNASVAWSDDFVHPHPRARGSMLVTPNGSSANGGAIGAHTPVGSINPSSRYTTSFWVYAPNGITLEPSIVWYDSSDAQISASTGTTTAVSSGVWTFVTATYTAPSTASRATCYARFSGTPAASAVFYVWNAKICRVNARYIWDEFGRTATDTWGNADSGQTWTNTGTAADYDVLSGYGRHTHPSASVGHHSVITALHPNQDMYARVATGALSTGASQFAGVLARYVDADNLYEARVEFTTANAVILSIRKRVSATETQLATYTTELVNVAGTFVNVRFRVSGSTLAAKIWGNGKPEPLTWRLSVTDSSLSAAGSSGVKSVRNTGNTNANADIRFDNVTSSSPQQFVITRSENGVVKSQAVSALSTVYPPTIVGL